MYPENNTAEALAQRAVPMGQMQPSGAAQAKFVICNQTIEYGFKHSKDDLGWADYRLTDSASIERWWELVMSAYTLVSLQTPDFAALGHVAAPAAAPPAAAQTLPPDAPEAAAPLDAHPAWDPGNGWKQHLNNLRLLLQPYTCSCLLLPWLHLVPLPHVQAVQTGLAALGSLVDTFRLALPT
jgi:hypothetical protein